MADLTSKAIKCKNWICTNKSVNRDVFMKGSLCLYTEYSWTLAKHQLTNPSVLKYPRVKVASYHWS